MPIQIHGKQYKTVAERVNEFRKAKKEMPILTELIADNGSTVIMKAIICNDEGSPVATGYAEEIRGSSNINKTSALENCETSAIGRALANLGFGGTEYASANEVTNAIIQQEVMKAMEGLQAHNEAVKRNIETIFNIKVCVANDDIEGALEAALEISIEDKKLLWIAPTKGGIFTTEERNALQKTNKLKGKNNG